MDDMIFSDADARSIEAEEDAAFDAMIANGNVNFDPREDAMTMALVDTIVRDMEGGALNLELATGYSW